MIKLIVGLANPGSKYANSRHNAGAWFVNLMAKRLYSSLYKENKFISYYAYVNIMGMNVHLMIPYTYMNLSGKAVSSIVTFHHINPNEILIVHDELNFPPGIAKFKLGGGHGGHNGLKDIISRLNEYNFYRLRIGIGRPENKDKIVDFVLNEPPICEKKMINEAINEAIYSIEIWFRHGLMKAINHLHTFKPIN